MDQSAYSLFQRGTELLDTNNPAQAAVLFERVKAVFPEKASVREALGRAYYNYGQHRLAAREFGKALEIEPTNHYAHFGLALCLRKLGKTARAKGHIKLAVAMGPKIEFYRQVQERLFSAV